MKTPRNTTFISMADNGQYWHHGFEFCLRNLFDKLDRSISISININVDGLPIFKSSLKNFWPILCSVQEFPEMPPFAVGIYYGTAKPKDASEFLTPFIDELLPILEAGMTVNGYLITVKIRCFICDSPARAFIKGVTSFNGKFGCLKCTTKGQYLHITNTMVYPDINATKRTDEDFREKKYLDHQRRDTPLTKLPIDLIEDVIVSDSLHLLELGVMKKLLTSWRTGKMTNKAKWSTFEKAKISEFLVNVRFPSEIHRRMRSLEFVSLWKGLEYRSFLNYVGIVILKSYLPEKYYDNFVYLYCAIRICSANKYKHLLPVARCLFNDFINSFKSLYGVEYVTSNIHNLCHVVDEVERFGDLSTLSAYPFENYLHTLKKLLKAGPNPLAQVANRISENMNAGESFSFEEQIISKSPISVEKTKKICKITFPSFILSTACKDRWFLSKSLKIVCVVNIIESKNDWKIEGQHLLNQADFFSKPFKSSVIHIYVANQNLKNRSKNNLYECSAIMCKLVAISCADGTVFIPLIHTLN
ncbi:uncharacterized protein LOC129754015 [Uranotaenia lowii]|uniref:uncharacterized protein LOC129754015 n=1 Tax=Uranotaenia lowii TaxID=190385 RepID=UPI002479041F|nr:uncharacterized protein LOC129754015 [Uranotaenia lowii]